jgi:hypothetical protein
MRGIAVDERAHAALAWSVDRWLAARLPSRKPLLRARARAIAALGGSLQSSRPEPIGARLGLPTLALLQLRAAGTRKFNIH